MVILLPFYFKKAEGTSVWPLVSRGTWLETGGIWTHVPPYGFHVLHERLMHADIPYMSSLPAEYMPMPSMQASKQSTPQG